MSDLLVQQLRNADLFAAKYAARNRTGQLSAGWIADHGEEITDLIKAYVNMRTVIKSLV